MCIRRCEGDSFSWLSDLYQPGLLSVTFFWSGSPSRVRPLLVLFIPVSELLFSQKRKLRGILSGANLPVAVVGTRELLSC